MAGFHPGHPRLEATSKGVDARNKSGHDDGALRVDWSDSTALNQSRHFGVVL